MPYLTFEILPPAPKSASSDCGVVEPQPEVKVSPLKPDSFTRERRVSSNTEDGVKEILQVKHPVVKLDVDRITDATAGRLATSLLGHVLFLKNQVPFPITQLGRIPGGKTNTRAAKQRAELLASFDTISSHLDTTFSALSTALARCSGGSNSNLAQAHLAILLGPSLGSAKSKIILGIDGLQPSVWGLIENAPANQQNGEDSEEEVDDHFDDENAESSDENEEGPEDSDEEYEDEDESGNEEEEDEDEEKHIDDVPLSSPPPPYITHAEEQKFLQHADRLLSRTLAAADAEGIGITSELSPTQTHILIRAPRRFSHPAWIPRQNVTVALESALQDFMKSSGLSSPDVELDTNVKHTKRSTVEGVWLTARTGLRRILDVNPEPNLEGLERTEDDDMIWWSWDGKFVGFADW